MLVIPLASASPTSVRTFNVFYPLSMTKLIYRIKHIIDQFTNLLKVQVGGLSRFVHSKSSIAGFVELRHCVDQLIRRVAALDEKADFSTKMDFIENILQQVLEAYRQVRFGPSCYPGTIR